MMRTILGQVVDDQLRIGERLAIDFGLLVEARVDRLQRLGQRAEQRLQQLRLLLEHAQVGHQLLVLFVRGRRGRRDARPRAPGRECRWKVVCLITLTSR